jgi:hypothetical protein
VQTERATERWFFCFSENPNVSKGFLRIVQTGYLSVLHSEGCDLSLFSAFSMILSLQ